MQPFASLALPSLSWQRPTPCRWAPLIHLGQMSQEGSCSSCHRTPRGSAGTGGPAPCPLHPNSASTPAVQEQSTGEHRDNTTGCWRVRKVTESPRPESLSFRAPLLCWQLLSCGSASQAPRPGSSLRRVS